MESIMPHFEYSEDVLAAGRDIKSFAQTCHLFEYKLFVLLLVG